MEWFGYALCILIGALIALSVQWMLLIWYIQSAPTGNPADLEEPINFCLPKNLENMGFSSENGDCAAAVSLTLQFLFQELKYAPAPLAWLYRKLHQEMLDLLTRTTSGKLFESLKVRNVLTGDVAPRIRWAGVENVEIGTGGYLKTVDLILDVHYSGGFKLIVDAGMLLGKTACFHVEVAHLSGRARVRFTREPYTHWSFSFLNPPHLDLNVQPLQKRIAALLQAHARRALQKRHTLPNYTIRYKPFFTKIDPAQFDPPTDDPTLKLQGTTFEINIVEISRLYTKLWSTNTENCVVYCSISLDSNPWISYRENDEYNIFTIDIVVNKERSQQLGTVFKQVITNSGDKSSKSYVVIETVVPLSAAYKADLRRDDIIIAIDSKLVSTMSQIVKTIKGINRPCFTIRIERRLRKQYPLKRDESQKSDTLSIDDGIDDTPLMKRGKSNSFSFRKMSEVLENAKNVGQEGKSLLKSTYIGNSQESEIKSNLEKTNSQDATKTNSDDSIKLHHSNSSNTVSFSKHNDSLSFGFGLRKRRCSVENKTSSDSSNSSTPTASNPGTPSKRTDRTNREQIKSNMEDNLNIQQNDNIHDSSKNEVKSPDFNDKLPFTDNSTVTPRISVIKVKENNEQSKSRNDNNEFTDLLQMHTSKVLPLCDIISFQEKISFKLNRNHRYVNLNIWGKNDNTEDTLLAYLNIPLQSILKECSASKVSQHLKKYPLLSPEVNLSVIKTHPLSTHSGFEPCLCYGDVLISSFWPNQINLVDSKSSQECKIILQNSESDFQDDFELIEPNIEETILKQKSNNEDFSWKSHDFIRTHFHRTTQCDFCKKKIWLKDAVQCRECAMCCHKKCVSKCLSSIKCPLSAVQSDEASSPSKEYSEDNVSHMPEFAMTEYITSSEESTNTQKHVFGQKSDEGLLGRNALSGLLGGLRRVGSAHNLSPPGPSTHTARSLPPSPHHTPSRSQSPDDDSAWHALEIAANDGIKNAADLLKPLLAAHLSSDSLLSKARDFGPRLLAHLPAEERTERISNLISEVRIALDEENSKLVDFQSSLSNKNLTSQERLRLHRSLEECEERSQALTALLLHCCSAMQSANKHSM